MASLPVSPVLNKVSKEDIVAFQQAYRLYERDVEQWNRGKAPNSSNRVKLKLFSECIEPEMLEVLQLFTFGPAKDDDGNIQVDGDGNNLPWSGQALENVVIKWLDDLSPCDLVYICQNGTRRCDGRKESAHGLATKS